MYRNQKWPFVYKEVIMKKVAVFNQMELSTYKEMNDFFNHVFYEMDVKYEDICTNFIAEEKSLEELILEKFGQSKSRAGVSSNRVSQFCRMHSQFCKIWGPHFTMAYFENLLCELSKEPYATVPKDKKKQIMTDDFALLQFIYYKMSDLSPLLSELVFKKF